MFTKMVQVSITLSGINIQSTAVAARYVLNSGGSGGCFASTAAMNACWTSGTVSTVATSAGATGYGVHDLIIAYTPSGTSTSATPSITTFSTLPQVAGPAVASPTSGNATAYAAAIATGTTPSVWYKLNETSGSTATNSGSIGATQVGTYTGSLITAANCGSQNPKTN
jgi:hypothetical protein